MAEIVAPPVEAGSVRLTGAVPIVGKKSTGALRPLLAWDGVDTVTLPATVVESLNGVGHNEAAGPFGGAPMTFLGTSEGGGAIAVQRYTAGALALFLDNAALHLSLLGVGSNAAPVASSTKANIRSRGVIVESTVYGTNAAPLLDTGFFYQLESRTDASYYAGMQFRSGFADAGWIDVLFFYGRADGVPMLGLAIDHFGNTNVTGILYLSKSLHVGPLDVPAIDGMIWYDYGINQYRGQRGGVIGSFTLS